MVVCNYRREYPALILRSLLVKCCVRKSCVGGEKDVTSVFNSRDSSSLPERKDAPDYVYIVIRRPSKHVSKFLFEFGTQRLLVNLESIRALLIARTRKRRDIEVSERFLQPAFCEDH